jgi:hypothetical protein
MPTNADHASTVPGRRPTVPARWSPPYGLQTNNLGKSVLTGTLDTPAKRVASDLAWPGQAASGSDNSDQQRKKNVAILALETVFAEYDR